MASHVSWEKLVHVFVGQGTPRDIRSATEHVPACEACWRLAARALAETRRGGILPRHAGRVGALITLLDGAEGEALARHVARGRWVTLSQLSRARMLDRVQNVEAMQEIGVAEAALEEAESVAVSDPVASEEVAERALVILEHTQCSPPEAQALKARATLAKGNSRRLLGDWDSASSHLAKARELARRGIRDETLEVRLLSIESSLAFDMGRVEDSLRPLREAEVILRRSNDWSGLGRLQVDAGSALATAGKAEEALALAREALQHLGLEEVRLRLLARLLATDCLIQLNHVPEALLEFEQAHPLFVECQTPVSRLQYRFYEARLLDALGHAREAESFFVEVAKGYDDREMYKNALLVRLALFEAAFKRGSLPKAAAICQEALAALRDSPAHPQMAEAWKHLLDLTRRQAVTGYAIAELRSYVNRHWVTPADPPRLVRKVGRPRSA